MKFQDHIDELKVVLGPFFLALGVVLYISPTLDQFERPETEDGLRMISGKVVTSSKTKRAKFIYIDDGHDEQKIKVFCNCQDQLVGKIVKAKTGADIIRRFDIAWRLESEGRLFYNLRSIEKNLMKKRKENSWIRISFVCIGLLITPYWYFTRKHA